MLPSFRVFLPAAAVTTLLVVLPTQAQNQELPDGAALMDQFVQASGGKEAYQKIKTRQLEGTLTLRDPRAGTTLTGKLVGYEKAPNLKYLAFDVPNIGRIESGTDGKVVWSRDPVNGVKLLSGVEKMHFLRSAAFDRYDNWRNYYTSAKTVGTDLIQGKQVYQVDLVTKDRLPVTHYFDKKTGLIVKTTEKLETPVGEVAVDIYADAYKKIDDVMTMTRARQRLFNLDMELEFGKIQNNVEIPAERFELPDDVKALLKKT